jgi:hypothetical protein
VISSDGRVPSQRVVCIMFVLCVSVRARVCGRGCGFCAMCYGELTFRDNVGL